MTLSRNRYVNLLRDQKGYHEGRDPSGNWNNHQKFSAQTAGLEWSDYQAWCHTFVSWGADELDERDALPITASCLTGVAWFKNRDRWTDYPVLGGLFYMGSGGGDHVGVVYAYDADSIYTIEGNTNSGGSYQGDGVYERTRPRRGAGSPYGYGIPRFSEPTVSADPALGGTKAASVPRTQEEEPDVALTDADVNKILAARIPIPAAPGRPAGMASLADIFGWTDNRHNVIYGEIQELKELITALLNKE